MTEPALASELIWGPIALFINVIQHGLPPTTETGFMETVVSAVGTLLWISAVGAIVGLVR